VEKEKSDLASSRNTKYNLQSNGVISESAMEKNKQKTYWKISSPGETSAKKRSGVGLKH